MCLGSWSLAGLIKDQDVARVTILPAVVGEEEELLRDGWDAIDI